MNIRLLEIDDWKLFRTLRLEAILNYPEAFSSSFEEEAYLSDEVYKSNFSTVFGAFNNHDLIGCVGFFIYSPLKMRHKGTLFSMYIKEDFRNQGIGNALLKTIIAHAKNTVHQLHLTVVTTNHTALKLYQKNGFKIYGTEPRALMVGDHFFDEHLMVLNLV